MVLISELPHLPDCPEHFQEGRPWAMPEMTQVSSSPPTLSCSSFWTKSAFLSTQIPLHSCASHARWECNCAHYTGEETWPKRAGARPAAHSWPKCRLWIGHPSSCSCTSPQAIKSFSVASSSRPVFSLYQPPWCIYLPQLGILDPAFRPWEGTG